MAVATLESRSIKFHSKINFQDFKFGVCEFSKHLSVMHLKIMGLFCNFCDSVFQIDIDFCNSFMVLASKSLHACRKGVTLHI